MSTTFPRREFTASDDCQTVSDLHLVPSAVILILPVRLNVVMHKYIDCSFALLAYYFVT
jgi:hypothetical protein